MGSHLPAAHGEPASISALSVSVPGALANVSVFQNSDCSRHNLIIKMVAVNTRSNGKHRQHPQGGEILRYGPGIAALLGLMIVQAGGVQSGNERAQAQSAQPLRAIPVAAAGSFVREPNLDRSGNDIRSEKLEPAA